MLGREAKESTKIYRNCQGIGKAVRQMGSEDECHRHEPRPGHRLEAWLEASGVEVFFGLNVPGARAPVHVVYCVRSVINVLMCVCVLTGRDPAARANVIWV